MRYWTLGACAVASILTGAARLYVHLATENRSHVKLLLRDAASARADLIRAHVVERLADAALFAQHGEVAGAVSPAESSAAVVAVARELAGFVWAIGCEVQTSGWQGLAARSNWPAW